MKQARILLALAALLLLATALFHGSGIGMVSSWLGGERGRILRMLWYLPAIDWTVIAAIWGYAALRPDRNLRPVIWLTAIVPLLVALMLIAAVGGGFPGIWMLLGAVGLAIAGTIHMRYRRA